MWQKTGQKHQKVLLERQGHRVNFQHANRLLKRQTQTRKRLIHDCCQPKPEIWKTKLGKKAQELLAPNILL
ncbi:hypothetical protein P3589_23610 [Vibrio parahaemolyticus]|nr:hypothetical protein [Vibrio parahaemolyticus]MDF5014942.1 hypothetical protein [Vibrio parahaemolyticus]HCG7776271.1 hypothetical protein [Vibrio parahaemolyticus]